MKRPYLPESLRERIRQRDRFRCAYCQTQVLIVASKLEIEHIVPIALGGNSTEDNLCLACSRCNRCKSDRVQVIDPLTDQSVPLFHPVRDHWDTHFAWSESGEMVVGKTAIGRATVDALQMNVAVARNSRRLWVAVGWHPPID